MKPNVPVGPLDTYIITHQDYINGEKSLLIKLGIHKLWSEKVNNSASRGDIHYEKKKIK